ncbi:MAG: hypothetical protein M0P95_07810 [Sulfuritalea sp.]|jgi:cytochrome c551/c552|nr:hypothetical protein [Sulfuritalea sp.]
MLPLSRMPIRIAVTALSLVAIGAQAQTNVLGRRVFEQKNCSQCHAYEARSLGPSVRNMKIKLKGDPTAASAGILAAADHALDLKSLSPENVRAMAEWLAATTFEEQAAVAAKPPPSSPAAKREAAAKAKREAQAKAKQEAEAKAQAKKDAAAKAKQDADGKAQAKRDAEAQAKREATAKQASADFAKREADAKARKDTGALEAIKREGDERARRDAEAQAAAKRDAEARTKREADSAAVQKREAEERARLEGEAKARKDAEALAAQKRDAETQAQAKKPDAATKAAPAAPGGKKQLAYRDGSDLPPCSASTGAALGTINEAGAKAIIERIGCPQCHAYVQKKVGTPMKQIQEKYKGDWECVVQRLKTTKTHKEEGVTDDLKGNDFKIVADYIATRSK